MTRQWQWPVNDSQLAFSQLVVDSSMARLPLSLNCKAALQRLNSQTQLVSRTSTSLLHSTAEVVPRRHLNRHRRDQSAGHQATPAGDDSQLWLAVWMTSCSASGPRLPSSPSSQHVQNGYFYHPPVAPLAGNDICGRVSACRCSGV